MLLNWNLLNQLYIYYKLYGLYIVNFIPDKTYWRQKEY